MKFEKISIRNFRNFENIEIGISNKNIFFGLNDIGKTNFLYAMRYVFDKDIRKNGFLDSDFHKKNVEIFMYICDTLGIDTFVVGDEKQSIYIWRGAYPEAFKSIWNKTNFHKVFMGDNFRSCQQIQNYSNLLCEETRGLYNPTESLGNIIWITPKQQEWPSEVLQYIDPQKRTALLRFRNADAENGASELSSAGNNFVFIPQLPIADITTETAWLYTAIAKYMVLPEYSVYDLISEIPAEGNSGKKSTATIKRTLEAIANAENQTVFDTTVNSLCDYLGYETRPEHLNKLFSTVSSKKYHVAFNTDIYQNIAITFHSSKGLEFDQVILFAGDYNLSDMSGIYNHYVAVTRAKEKVVIVKCSDYYANRFESNLSQIFALSGLKTCNLVTYK